tara:strand:+ start:127 stop:1134 length:1008 start_codon:yes stop_codon:yes gene_type:complete
MANILVVGCGSIGRRHLRVFRANGDHFLGGVDRRDDRLDQADGEVKLDAKYKDYRDALNDVQYDAVIIATPPHIHTEIAQVAAESGCHLFIEKPLAMTESGLEKLCSICEQKSIICYTAYCYRFIPSVEHLRQKLEQKVIGDVLSVRLHISSYLPDWHPWEDYRTFYMAKKEEGGGALLDESHGIDLIRWLFGEVDWIHAYVGNVSELEITSDDISVMFMGMQSNAIVEAHFDLLGRTPRIGMEVIGSKGTLIWDRIDPSIRIYDAESSKWSEEKFDSDDTVQSYDLQVEHFLKCIKASSQTRNNLKDGWQTLKVLTAALESNKTQKVCKVEKVG